MCGMLDLMKFFAILVRQSNAFHYYSVQYNINRRYIYFVWQGLCHSSMCRLMVEVYCAHI